MADNNTGTVRRVYKRAGHLHVVNFKENQGKDGRLLAPLGPNGEDDMVREPGESEFADKDQVILFGSYEVSSLDGSTVEQWAPVDLPTKKDAQAELAELNAEIERLKALLAENGIEA